MGAMDAATRLQRETTATGPGIREDALASLAELEFRMGDWQGAYASAVEVLRLALATGRPVPTMQGLAGLALVEAGLGRAEACRRHGQHALLLAGRQRNVACAGLARGALGLLELGLCRLDAAVGWLEPLTGGSGPVAGRWVCDLAEALIRRGDRRPALETLAALGVRHGTAEMLTAGRALERCRGLLAPDHEFETHFTRALDGGAHEPFELARTELSFGQRLRRAGNRVGARKQLHAALEGFERLRAEPWAHTTRRELGASAATARRRVDATRDELTAQERQVAQIVAEGATNREAAGRLFVTTKTIETHLSHIYRKLAVRSRTELARRLHASPDVATQR
jgi:DNA-binding CsgD family transcriptional regulator